MTVDCEGRYDRLHNRMFSTLKDVTVRGRSVQGDVWGVNIKRQGEVGPMKRRYHIEFRISAVFIFLAVLILTQVPAGPVHAEKRSSYDIDYIRWLESRSMLYQAEQLARKYQTSGELWRYPYALPQPRRAAACASVWFTAYPAATVTRDGESVIKTLGDEALWKAFHQIGIKAVHTGPMKRAGGIMGREYTPTIDGNFDRIAMEIDPAFGSDREYIAMSGTAASHGAIVIGDIIPGHTGKGADFRLAEGNYRDYPGIYHMVPIDQKDWSLLPPVPEGKDSVNLKEEAVKALKDKGYIVGPLTRTIFYEPGIKDTDWSATDIVKGVDGVPRRWVYLHYFKDGQPTLNWLAPNFSAERLLIGDMLHSMTVLGEKMLRLDANGFLGIEPGQKADRAWSEGHPLSVTSNELIGMMTRKLGGFTFQELNLTLEDIKAMSSTGADLSYDFITRPACHHALVTGDTSFLRLMFGLMNKYQIDPAGLIHALQNHDELTLELVHFWTGHNNDIFSYRDRQIKGSELRDDVRREMQEALLAPKAPYNLKASNGVSCTTASLCAAALGIRDIKSLTGEEKDKIKRLHLLLVMYNAFQPGVLALSGWDLVGALTLPGDSVKELLADGDTRWINRGAYDLMGVNKGAAKSPTGLPRAESLYGTLPEQLKDPDSFASTLKSFLKAREHCRIAEAELLPLPDVKSKSLLVMVSRLPDRKGFAVTALNFGKTAVEESVVLGEPKSGTVTGLLPDTESGSLGSKGELGIKLAPYEGRVYLVQ